MSNAIVSGASNEMQPDKTDNLTRIRLFLKGGAKITVLTVFRYLSTLEARHYIAMLRKEGMPIKDRWLTNQNGKKFKEWFLEFK